MAARCMLMPPRCALPVANLNLVHIELDRTNALVGSLTPNCHLALAFEDAVELGIQWLKDVILVFLLLGALLP